MLTAGLETVRSLVVTAIVALLVASTMWWALSPHQLTVDPSGGGVRAVSTGMALALIKLLVLGTCTGLLVRASRRRVVPAAVVLAQAVLSLVLIAFLWTATGWMQARTEEIARTPPDWSASPEAVDIEVSRLHRDYWDSINAEVAMCNRIVAVQLVACWCALWAALQPDRRLATVSRSL
jgi:hypothetical protein